MRRARVAICAMLLMASACSDAERASVARGDVGVVADYPAPQEYAAGHFGIGRVATSAEIASWDTDVGPDGIGLPPGRGSAQAGALLFTTQCAACHGANGQGMAPVFPALIGRDPRGESFDFASDPAIPRTIGNYWPYATTLYDYIRRAMPLYTPGSLTADETYAITAYLLAANRVISDTTVLDAAALRAVRMPARDRFVADDRSPTIR